MPRVVPPDELDQIVAVVCRGASPLGIDQLLSLVHAVLPTQSRRTLQRRLSVLVSAERLVREGEGRAARYRPNISLNLQSLTPEIHISGESYVPTSTGGAEVRAYVRQAVVHRRPVGYQLSFLERYAPNETFYLAESLRSQLHAIGRSPVGEAIAGTFARDIMSRLVIDLAWASSRLEGNTYSRLDTEKLIEFGQSAQGKDATETQMILNHKAAIEYLIHDADHVGVNRQTLLNLHALLSDGLLPDATTAGRVRGTAVEVSGSVYRPVALPQQLDELFDTVVSMAGDILDPFEQAFFLMVHVPYLQPFIDVNKRVSRLAANIPLIRNNLCPLSFLDVPQRAYVDATLGVYELNRVDLLRDVFVWSYERSCQQYVAVRQQLIPPDTFRLRYRKEVSATVQAIVRAGKRASAETIRHAMPQTVTQQDRSRFIELLLVEFETMHASNVVRFGLRPLEFAEWTKVKNKSLVRSKK